MFEAKSQAGRENSSSMKECAVTAAVSYRKLILTFGRPIIGTELLATSCGKGASGKSVGASAAVIVTPGAPNVLG
jgi:hypothetical protein